MGINVGSKVNPKISEAIPGQVQQKTSPESVLLPYMFFAHLHLHPFSYHHSLVRFSLFSH